MKFTEESTQKYKGRNVWLYLKNGKIVKEKVLSVVWESDDEDDQYMLTDKMIRHFSNIRDVKILD